MSNIDELQFDISFLELHKQRVYIAGPITGYPGWNKAAFTTMEVKLQSLGHDTINPNNSNCVAGPFDRYTDWLRRDIIFMLSVTVVVFLPGWRESRGSKMEFAIAKGLGLPTWEVKGSIVTPLLKGGSK